MSDDKPSIDPGATHDLRTITARLSDLQRKCRSVGSRNQEAEEIEQRLNSILDRLNPEDDDDDAPPIPFGGLARELYAVERFFESNGFLSVAKEVAHVERALEALAVDGEPEPESMPAPISSTPTTEGAVLNDRIEIDEDRPKPSRWAIPKPLAAVLALFVAAVVACAAVIYYYEHHEPDEAASLQIPAPTPIATRRPSTPKPTPAARNGDPTPAPGAVLAREIGRARLALAAGDVDAVIDHLSRAALVDADHATVLGTARQVVDLLLERADSAADGGLWEIADLTLARADRLATRYGLDRHRIESSARRYAQMDRFRLVNPSDRRAIRAAAGSRVSVVLRDGSTQDSIIKGVEGNELLLEEDTEVRGGAMYYTERIPLTDIDYLKVWER